MHFIFNSLCCVCCSSVGISVIDGNFVKKVYCRWWYMYCCREAPLYANGVV